MIIKFTISVLVKTIYNYTVRDNLNKLNPNSLFDFVASLSGYDFLTLFCNLSPTNFFDLSQGDSQESSPIFCVFVPNVQL
jgi:hypothetical protein